MKEITILVASNCQVRYELKLEAMIRLFGTGTETVTLLILAAAQLHICGTQTYFPGSLADEQVFCSGQKAHLAASTYAPAAPRGGQRMAQPSLFRFTSRNQSVIPFSEFAPACSGFMGHC